MTPVRLLVVFLFAAVNVFGQQSPSAPISVDPTDPTSSDDVTLVVLQFDSCPPPPTVIRSGFDITVTLNPGPCAAPPTWITHNLDLGKLAAGEYNVTVVHPPLSPPARFSFVVLDSNGTVSVAQQVGSSAGGTAVNIVVAAAHCLNKLPTSCPPPSITFGGVPATNIVVIDQSHFRATTPPHAAGAVQVTVSDDTFTKSSYAFRYYDPAAAPSDKFFEKVLIPVIFNGPGSLGSNWVTELSLRNANDYPIEPWRPIAGSTAIPPSKPLLFGSGNAPSGLFLVLPRPATNVRLHAGVRDVSHSADEWSTEIPVVRESDFSKSGIDLLDIPSAPTFRTMLRIYSTINPGQPYSMLAHVMVTRWMTAISFASGIHRWSARSCAVHQRRAPSIRPLPESRT